MHSKIVVALSSLALWGCQVDSEVGSNHVVAAAQVDAARFFDAEHLPACIDSVDNDGDGVTDYPFEIGCISMEDDDETDPWPLPACSNGGDDDSDGVGDFPLEPGCSSAADEDEANPVELPECADGLDNDGDGDIDYPAEDGCFAAGDGDEATITS